jgi:hypothetical protein
VGDNGGIAKILTSSKNLLQNQQANFIQIWLKSIIDCSDKGPHLL